MMLALALLCFVGFLCSFCPCCLLIKIAWQDRHLPSDHIDYRKVWGGKKLVYATILMLLAVSGGAAWMGYYFLMA